MTTNGKGSSRRPRAITRTEEADRWHATFDRGRISGGHAYPGAAPLTGNPTSTPDTSADAECASRPTD